MDSEKLQSIMIQWMCLVACMAKAENKINFPIFEDSKERIVGIVTEINLHKIFLSFLAVLVVIAHCTDSPFVVYGC